MAGVEERLGKRVLAVLAGAVSSDCWAGSGLPVGTAKPV